MLSQVTDVGFESIMLDQNLGAPELFNLNQSDPRLAIVRRNVRKANAAGVAVGAYGLMVEDRGATGYGVHVPAVRPL